MTRPRTGAALITLGASGLGPATAAAERGDVEETLRLSGRAILGRAAYAGLSAARKEQALVNTISAEWTGSGFPALDDDALRGIRTPTLLVTGASSPRAFHRLADRVEELMPRTERVEIPGASHLMHEDNAAAFNAAVGAFIARHRPAA